MSPRRRVPPPVVSISGGHRPDCSTFDGDTCDCGRPPRPALIQIGDLIGEVLDELRLGDHEPVPCTQVVA